jgi:hypothetical protein
MQGRLAVPACFLFGVCHRQVSCRGQATVPINFLVAPCHYYDYRCPPSVCLLSQDLRSLLQRLPPADLALAGHAMALSQWHHVRRWGKLCSRCQAAALPALMQQCTAHRGPQLAKTPAR